MAEQIEAISRPNIEVGLPRNQLISLHSKTLNGKAELNEPSSSRYLFLIHSEAGPTILWGIRSERS